MEYAEQPIKQTPPRKPKTLYSLDSPYSPAQWQANLVLNTESPTDSFDLKATSSSSLLSPIGHHRSQNAILSKGKRHRKRKRIEKGQEAQDGSYSLYNNSGEKPNYPDLQKYITVGFNSTNRCLENFAVARAKKKEGEAAENNCSWMDAVFVARADQPPMLHAHLPLLIKAASLANLSKPPIRLVSLPSKAEERLIAALKLRRVGVIGLLNEAPGADALVEFLRMTVSVVEVPWLQEATVGRYLPVEIRAVETSAPVEEKRKRLRQEEIVEKD